MAIAEPSSVREPYEVVALDRVTETIIELWLAPLGEPLDFTPGQYVLLEDLAGERPPRSYSVANAPREDGRISLLVTLIPNGLTSPWVHGELSVDDQVLVTGPYGAFVESATGADPGAGAPMLALGGGSGLAPLRALLEAALAAARRSSLELIFSARTEAEVLSRMQLERWAAANPRFSFTRTLTRGDGSEPPPHGRIPTFLADLHPDLSAHELFVAGNPGFVRDCVAAARALGAGHEPVHTEVFFAEPVPWSTPPRAGTG